MTALTSALGESARLQVPVIPLQMTEAWALADLDALQSVLSTSCNAQDLGLPTSAAALERVRDPKALLEQVVTRAQARTARAKTGFWRLLP